MIFDILFFLYLLSSISIFNHPSVHYQSVVVRYPHPVFHPQPLTLKTIFESGHSWTATLSAEKVISITTVGDIMLGREITARNLKTDFSFLYASVSALLSPADITVANLETPIIEDCLPTSLGMVFCAPTAHLKPLAASGIDLLSLANNHAYDHGPSGFSQTADFLASAGLTPLLPNEINLVRVKNFSLAFIPVNYIPGRRDITPSDSLLSQTISGATSSADIVIVLPHWGIEYAFTPSSHQIRLARLMIDSGADLVLGSHPHWIQPVEIYRGKLIVYSHGNFIFDQFWSRKTREGIIGNYIFYDGTLVDTHFIPVFIRLDGQPQPMDNPSSNSIIQSLYSASVQQF